MKNHYITIHGVTKTVTEWCEEYGVPRQRYYQRKRLGDDDERALRPVRPVNRTRPRDDSLEARAQACGITLQTSYRRIARGMTPEEALSIPPHQKREDGKTPSAIWKACEEHGITTSTYYKRISSGMTPEEALMTPKYNRVRKLEYTTAELRGMCEKAGVSLTTYYSRRKRGLSHEEALGIGQD